MNINQEIRTEYNNVYIKGIIQNITKDHYVLDVTSNSNNVMNHLGLENTELYWIDTAGKLSFKFRRKEQIMFNLPISHPIRKPRILVLEDIYYNKYHTIRTKKETGYYQCGLTLGYAFNLNEKNQADGVVGILQDQFNLLILGKTIKTEHFKGRWNKKVGESKMYFKNLI